VASGTRSPPTPHPSRRRTCWTATTTTSRRAGLGAALRAAYTYRWIPSRFSSPCRFPLVSSYNAAQNYFYLHLDRRLPLQVLTPLSFNWAAWFLWSITLVHCCPIAWFHPACARQLGP
jgi:hypothetical protein